MEQPADVVLLIGHGSLDDDGMAESRRFAHMLASHLSTPIEPGFLELADPPIVDGIAACVARNPRRIIALPLLLGSAGHYKNDIPTLLQWARTQWPRIEFRYGTPLGAQYPLVRALADRAAEAIAALHPCAAAETALLLVGRGSHDPDSNSDLAKIARLLWEGRGYGWVESAYYSLTPPDVQAGIGRCARLGARRIVVLPYLLFAGRICRFIGEQARKLQSQLPDVEIVVGKHLGLHPGVLAAVTQRYQEILNGTATMTCDLCKYRQRMDGFEAEYGLPQTTDHHHGMRGVAHRHGAPSALSILPPRYQGDAAVSAAPMGAADVEIDVNHARSIAERSFTIIRAELAARGTRLAPPLDAVVERIIHSTADFEFATITRASSGAVEAGVDALRGGRQVVTDVQMVRAGISAARLAALGGLAHCFVAEEETRRRAAAECTTRSAMGIRVAAERGLLEGGIVAIGNAPTALDEIVRLIGMGARPALVIGVPVGFVGTAESKAALMRVASVPWIATDGRKGGSPVAVAVVNALLRLAAGADASEID